VRPPWTSFLEISHPVCSVCDAASLMVGTPSLAEPMVSAVAVPYLDGGAGGGGGGASGGADRMTTATCRRVAATGVGHLRDHYTFGVWWCTWKPGRPLGTGSSAHATRARDLASPTHECRSTFSGSHPRHPTITPSVLTALAAGWSANSTPHHPTLKLSQVPDACLKKDKTHCASALRALARPPKPQDARAQAGEIEIRTRVAHSSENHAAPPDNIN
jgi:hypothetical protein